MTVDPRWSFWLSMSLAVCGFLAGAGSQFTDLGLSPTIVKAALALITLTMGIGNAVNAVLAAIPSKDAQKGFYLGPKTTTPPTGPTP